MNLKPITFTREIPLFPLPNCVLFPGVVQPLHIFEPRYRAMMQDTLEEEEAGSGSPAPLALALLKPGWQKTYHGTPPVHELLCAGRIIAHERLSDGKFNLLLQGVARARVLTERPCAGEWGAYRMAMLEEVPDRPAPEDHLALQRRMLRELFAKSALKELTVTPALAPLFEESIPATRLIDALAFSLIQDVAAKQQMLEEPDVALRGELLLRELVALAARLDQTGPGAGGAKGNGITWPPDMGVN